MGQTPESLGALSTFMINDLYIHQEHISFAVKCNDSIKVTSSWFSK